MASNRITFVRGRTKIIIRDEELYIKVSHIDKLHTGKILDYGYCVYNRLIDTIGDTNLTLKLKIVNGEVVRLKRFNFLKLNKKIFSGFYINNY